MVRVQISRVSNNLIEQGKQEKGDERHGMDLRCACDVPVHSYTYSFQPKDDWSRIYAASKKKPIFRRIQGKVLARTVHPAKKASNRCLTAGC